MIFWLPERLLMNSIDTLLIMVHSRLGQKKLRELCSTAPDHRPYYCRKAVTMRSTAGTAVSSLRYQGPSQSNVSTRHWYSILDSENFPVRRSQKTDFKLGEVDLAELLLALAVE